MSEIWTSLGELHRTKSSQKDQDRREEEDTNNIKCANCQESHSAFAKSCYTHKEEKEIMEVNHRKCIIFPGSKELFDSYMKDHIYANVVQKLNPVGSTNSKKHRNIEHL